jgi:hypothetical protein
LDLSSQLAAVSGRSAGVLSEASLTPVGRLLPNWPPGSGHSARKPANAGAGVQYVIKEKEGMVLNLEYAKGKGDNEGVYLKFGYGY